MSSLCCDYVDNTIYAQELLKSKNININLVDLEGSKPSDMTNNEVLNLFK